jgi:hypothetical protein
MKGNPMTEKTKDRTTGGPNDRTTGGEASVLKRIMAIPDAWKKEMNRYSKGDQDAGLGSNIRNWHLKFIKKLEADLSQAINPPKKKG